VSDIPDPWASLGRLAAAIEALDDRAATVLAYHAAIERELDLAIARHLPKPERLRKLSFGHKVSVWASLQNVSEKTVDRTRLPLLKFNDLRNAIAHGDKKREVDATFKKLLESIPVSRADLDLKGVAAYIFGALNSKVFGGNLWIGPDERST
jgi:hypothetical protein